MDKRQKDFYIYQQNFYKQNYDRLCYKTRKTERLPERIRIAAELHSISPAKYAIQAIETALQLDGITVESLPDRTESVKHD